MALRRRLCWLLLLSALPYAVSSPAEAATRGELGKIQFLAPDEGVGSQKQRFRISATLRLTDAVTGRIESASVNGAEVFRAGSGEEPRVDTLTADGKPLTGAQIDGRRELIIQFYYNWVTNERYKLAVTVKAGDGTFACESPVVSAPKGGAWRSDFPGFKVVSITEAAGIERKNWPVVVGLCIEPDQVRDPRTDLFLVRFDRAADRYQLVPFQVLDETKPVYAAENAGKPPKNKTVVYNLCFLADVERSGTSYYFLYYGRAGTKIEPAKYTSGTIEYAGEGLGVSAKTGPVTFSFDAKSGQLFGYTPWLADHSSELTFVQQERRPIHWNPDVWAPPASWGHVSDWGHGTSAAPQVTRSKGPIAFRTVRTGTMPNSNGVKVSVSYTAFAGAPFILESSLMEFTAATEVNAVRNNELVFSRGMHTQAVWCTEDDEVKAAPCYDTQNPRRFMGMIAELGPDIPWLGFYHERSRFGIAVVNLARYDYAAGGAYPQDFNAHYYISDPGIFGTDPSSYGLNFTYLCRPLVYHHTVVPKGAVFAEHSAFVVFKLGEGEGKFDGMKQWAQALRQPPKIDVR